MSQGFECDQVWFWPEVPKEEDEEDNADDVEEIHLEVQNTTLHNYN